MWIHYATETRKTRIFKLQLVLNDTVFSSLLIEFQIRIFSDKCTTNYTSDERTTKRFTFFSPYTTCIVCSLQINKTHSYRTRKRTIFTLKTYIRGSNMFNAGHSRRIPRKLLKLKTVYFNSQQKTYSTSRDSIFKYNRDHTMVK